MITREFSMDCGPFVWRVVNQVETDPLDSIFTDQVTAAPYSLAVFTTDSSKVRTYPLRIKVWLLNWPSAPVSSKDFTVVVQDACETSFSVVPSAPPADLEYVVARPAKVSPPFTDFEVTPAYCPFTSYMIKVTPVLLPPDDNAIVLKSETKEITI